jgi:hypothetical protein
VVQHAERLRQHALQLQLEVQLLYEQAVQHLMTARVVLEEQSRSKSNPLTQAITAGILTQRGLLDAEPNVAELAWPTKAMPSRQRRACHGRQPGGVARRRRQPIDGKGRRPNRVAQSGAS